MRRLLVLGVLVVAILLACYNPVRDEVEHRIRQEMIDRCEAGDGKACEWLREHPEEPAAAREME